jgi:two-component system response regulator YesN
MMYSLLIVDDEPLSQVGLRSMLDWEALGVSIVGTAPNGECAFELIVKLKPDIVITDVRMPILDGPGLVERCRAELEGGGPEFVMLSGYADFDAARRSMRGGAVDYLVKLELDQDGLRVSIEKAKAAVREKRRLGLSSMAQPGRPAPFAEAALARLLAGGYADSEEARGSLERSGLSVEDLRAAAGEGERCVASLRAHYANEERLSEEERMRAYCCAIDLVKEVAGREAAVITVPFDVSSFAVILCFSAAEGVASGATSAAVRAARALGRAIDIAEKLFGVALSGGIGSGRRDLLGAADSYREAMRAVASATEKRRLVAFEELSPGRAGAQRIENGSSRAAARRAAVVDAVTERSASGLRAVFDEAVAELSPPALPTFEGPSKAETLEHCCELLYPMLERLESGEAILSALFPDEAEGWRCLFSADSPAQFRAWLETVKEGLALRFESSQYRGRNPLVSGVQKYVRENYSSRLSLVDVAKRFEVSPNYLSALFKKYADIGYAEFVAQVKIEKAKELIVGGRYKMFEVAQLVGFEDAFYFSKVFKRVSGMSPREYYLSQGKRGPSRSATSEPGDI